MPQIGIRITHELHGRIQDTADEQNISISDFVRHAALHMLNGCQAPLNSASQELVSHLQHEAQEKKNKKMTRCRNRFLLPPKPPPSSVLVAIFQLF